MKTMQLGLKLSHKVLLLVVLPLVFELGLLAVLAVLLSKSEAETFREHHARAVIAESNALLKNFMDAGILFHLYKTTKNESFLQRQLELLDEIPKEFRSLKVMVADSPQQAKMLENFDKVCRKGLLLLSDARRVGGDDSSAFRWQGANTELAEITDELVNGLRKFVKEMELGSQIGTEREAALRKSVTLCLYFGAALNIIIAVALAVYFNRGTSSRLLVLVDNTKRLAQGLPLTAAAPGQDEIAHLDKVFHDMADALADAAKRKAELVSMVTHDLRTPLTSIQSTLTLLSEGVLGEIPPKAAKKVNIASDSTRRLIGLINDLLDIEKLEAGKMQIVIKDCSASPIVDASVNAVAAFADEAGVGIEKDPAEYMVQADADRVVQVIINLLSNAVKFSPRDSLVKLELEKIGDWLEFRVVDQGRGIPEEHLSKVFERFSQVDPNNPTERKGTGLGLPICKAIIEGHGGSIGVKSKPGEGSNFWFRLKSSERG